MTKFSNSNVYTIKNLLNNILLHLYIFQKTWKIEYLNIDQEINTFSYQKVFENQLKNEYWVFINIFIFFIIINRKRKFKICIDQESTNLISFLSFINRLYIKKL